MKRTGNHHYPSFCIKNCSNVHIDVRQTEEPYPTLHLLLSRMKGREQMACGIVSAIMNCQQSVQQEVVPVPPHVVPQPNCGNSDCPE